MNKYRIKFITLIVLSAGSFFHSCTKKDELDGTGHTPEQHHEQSSAVKVSKKQFEAIKIETGIIEQRNLSSVLRANGFLKVPPQNKASISSALGGSVQSILVQEGDFVRKGQSLATISNFEFVKLQQDYLEVFSQLKYAELEFKRQKDLSDKSISAQKTVQLAEANFNSLKAKANSLKQQLKLINIDPSTLNSESISEVINVRSPISGNVSHIYINIGTTLSTSKELMDIVDNSQLHLDLFVYEQDLRKISKGQAVDVSLTNVPGRHYVARVFAIGSAFEGDSKGIPIHASIVGDKSGLIEGMNVSAFVNVGTATVPSVPTNSVTSSGGLDYVFIQVQSDGSDKNLEEYSYKKIQIKRGTSSGDYIEITPLSEIPVGSKIVTNGAFYLMAMLTNDGEHE